MTSETITIENPKGLHLRPVTMMSEAACRYTASCRLESGGRTADIKSVLSLLAAGLRCGDTVRILCDGPDEEEAVRELSEILKGNAGNP